MPTVLHEWHGYLATDASPRALAARNRGSCPILGSTCEKRSGVCSLAVNGTPIPVCPVRVHEPGHLLLKSIAAECFADLRPAEEPDGTILLVPGSQARRTAIALKTIVVGVFGGNWDGEIRLPAAAGSQHGYLVDFVLVAVDPDGEPLGILPIEVQTIDTTGNYAAALRLLRTHGTVVRTRSGMNWENVNKRILPQLIVKGLMLQGERLCSQGIFFVTPTAVYDRIMTRLGGEHRLREIPRQPASITFVRVEYEPDVPSPGSVARLRQLPWRTVSTSDMSLAFVTPENLPPPGSYEQRVRSRL